MIIVTKDTNVLIKNVLLAIVIKGGALLINMLMTPMYIRYFNNDVVLGLWFTLYSMLSWILNFDLGIGNGLRNKLTVALSNKNHKKAGEIIYTAYFITFLFCIGLLLVYVGVNRLIDWREILKISTTDISNEVLAKALYIVIVSILTQMFLRTISYVYYAEQRPNINNLTSISTSLFILVYLVLARYLPFTKGIVQVAYVNLIGTNLPLILVTLLYFAKHPMYLKQKKVISKENIKDVLSLGIKFFYIQLMYMVIASTNEFFINYYCGQKAVVEYSIYNKLFTIIGLAITVIMLPVWSAITKAQAEGRYEWVKKLFSFFIVIGIAGTLFNLVMAAFSQIIFNVWLGVSTITSIKSYSIICALYGATMGVTSILSSFANGMSAIKVQGIVYTIVAIAKIFLAGLASSLYGWIGIILISVIGMITFTVIQTIDLYKKINRNI